MSREIGNLVYFEAGEKPEYFKGRVDLPGLYGECFLVPNDQKRSDNSPDYRLKMMRGRRPYEMGAAWKRQARQTGEEYLSITVDGPELKAPVYCSAFLLSPENQPDPETPDHWRIVWGRARSSAPAAGASEGVGDDIIPY